MVRDGHSEFDRALDWLSLEGAHLFFEIWTQKILDELFRFLAAPARTTHLTNLLEGGFDFGSERVAADRDAAGPTPAGSVFAMIVRVSVLDRDLKVIILCKFRIKNIADVFRLVKPLLQGIGFLIELLLRGGKLFVDGLSLSAGSQFFFVWFQLRFVF